MSKKVLTKNERRWIIILMAINLFALFVNYFSLSPKFIIGDYKNETEVFLFTDSKERFLISSTGGLYNMDGSSMMYENRHPKHFYPFVIFYDKDVFNKNKTRFRGIFPDYDHTEFIVYTFLIFGFFFVRKLW